MITQKPHKSSPIILLDLDLEDPKKIIDKFRQKVNEKYNNNSGISLTDYSKPVEKIECASLYSVTITKNDDQIVKLHLILFKKNLEDMTKINKEKDLEDEKIKKFEDYISQNRFYELIFSKTLQD